MIGVGVVWLVTRFKKHSPPNAEQTEKKQENLNKVLELARSRGEISNDDVQNALGVSDATATNYLAELEKQGKLVQIGVTGQAVRYRLNG